MINYFSAMRKTAVAAIPVCFLVFGPGLLFSSCHRVGGVKEKQSDNYVKNGDFEQVDNGRFAHWNVTGKVKPEAVSGVWRRLTTKFRSGPYKEVYFYLFVTKGTMGSVWIDNLVTGPQIELKNPGFEELNADGSLSGWEQDNTNVSVFSDSTRASEGRKSVRITHTNEVVPETRIWQKFPVETNKEYTLSFDMFVGDDFQGEAKGWLIDPTQNHSIDFDGPYKNLLASTLVEDRDRSDRYAVDLAPVAGEPAGLSQDVAVEPNANLHASIDLDNSTFKGKAKFTIEDAVSGGILKESNVTNVNEKWQSVEFSFQSLSPELRVRVIAEGEGILRIDNVAVTCPRVVPSLQQVKWLPATENFRVPSPLKVFIQGQTDKANDGGLALLSGDLKQYGIVVEKSDSDKASLRILIGAKHAVKGKGDEAYALTINNKGIAIKAGKEAGAFYGLMTLLQLIESRDGKPVVPSCEATDYPDMPLRGIHYGNPEQAARLKMNTVSYSTGYPTSIEEKKSLSDFVRKCERLNLKVIPHFITIEGGHYVQKINPNLAAGIWVKDEQLTLRGAEPSPLANRYVIRTGLTDVQLKSLDGKTEYILGKDYQVINGEMAYPYKHPDPKPFAVARLPGSSIPDGGSVSASYDYVSYHRSSTGKTEPHVAYCPLEPEVPKLMGEFIKNLARDYPFTYIDPAQDLHEFRAADSQLETDSRVIKSGKKPIELAAENLCFLDRAAKSGNPRVRVVQFVGNVGEYVKAAGPHLPKDARITIWGFEANWPAGYGREAVEYWTKLGHETSVLAWTNLRNIRGWAQVIAEARRKGYPCIGMLDACWEHTSDPPNPYGMKETAIVSWKIPKEGERGFVSLPEKEDVKPKEEGNK